MNSQQVHAFTSSYDGLSLVLNNEITVSKAFDPQKQKIGEQKKFRAIWDTGATASVITKNVAEQCGLSPISKGIIHTAGGTVTRDVYLASFCLPNSIIFPVIRVTEGDIGQGFDILIGMDIICTGDFAVSNFQGKTVFTFRIPSVEQINFLKNSKSATLEVPAQNKYEVTSRNNPCPCGSGKKYKKCHGA